MKKVNFKTLGLLVGVGIIALGGTILPTADAEAFNLKKTLKKAGSSLKSGGQQALNAAKSVVTNPNVQGAVMKQASTLAQPFAEAGKQAGAQILQTAQNTAAGVAANAAAKMQGSGDGLTQKVQNFANKINTSIAGAGNAINTKLAGMTGATNTSPSTHENGSTEGA